VLRAPISGQVAQRLAQSGERVAIDARILEIVDLSRMELETSLSPADSLDVRIGQTAQLTLEGSSRPVHATVSRINPSATGGSRTVLAYLSLQGYAGLRQGLFAQGTLSTGSASAIALPLEAVRTDKPQPYVQWISEGRVKHQTVETGSRGDVRGQTMVVVRGIPAGSEVLAGTVGVVPDGTAVQRTGGQP